MSNPYRKLVSEYARLLREGAAYPLGNVPPAPRGVVARDAQRVLIFSPHPDDECVVGALPLRLLRERKMSVINVAVTLGSRKERQLARLAELKNACDYLGFGLVPAAERGLEKVNPAGREQHPAQWAESVTCVARILANQAPQVVFMPHAKDWNTTHIGTHGLVEEAFKKMSSSFRCWVCETEYWAAMDDPNLMIESSVADVADLIAALSFHVGEVQRNPYHLRMPAWLQDNVRRGGELVGGQGGAAPDYVFATLYRLRRWSHGKYETADKGGTCVSCNDSLERLFG